jgi:hypothetical protein
MVRYFHKHRLSEATICRWKYIYEDICEHFKPCDPSPNIFELHGSYDISEETGHLGVFVCYKKQANFERQETFYQFYLYTPKTQTFWDIDLNLKSDLFIYRIHSLEKHNILVYHYFNSTERGSVVFNFNNLTNENFCTIVNINSQTILIMSAETKFHHCDECHYNFPNIDINDLPFYNYGLSPLPDGDRLFLEGPKEHGYDLCSELKGIITPLTMNWLFPGRIFGDRYYLSIDCENKKINVLDVLTQKENICFVEENAQQLFSKNFTSISTIDEHNGSFYFSNRKLQNWFILRKNHSDDWFISMLIQKDAISKPTFCPFEQSFVW